MRSPDEPTYGDQREPSSATDLQKPVLFSRSESGAIQRLLARDEARAAAEGKAEMEPLRQARAHCCEKLI